MSERAGSYEGVGQGGAGSLGGQEEVEGTGGGQPAGAGDDDGSDTSDDGGSDTTGDRERRRKLGRAHCGEGVRKRVTPTSSQQPGPPFAQTGRGAHPGSLRTAGIGSPACLVQSRASVVEEQCVRAETMSRGLTPLPAVPVSARVTGR